MNEHDWLTGTDFTAHVRFVADRLSPRRQRLLAVAFCRAADDRLGPDLAAALGVVERYADGQVPTDHLGRIRQRCRDFAAQANERYTRHVDFNFDVAPEQGGDPREAWATCELAWAIANAASTPFSAEDVGTRVLTAVAQAPPGPLHAPLVPSLGVQAAPQNLVLREAVWEVIGNPFRPAPFAPEWRTDTVRAIAAQMYDSRDFSAMPILADALQDAGCDSTDILNHCRAPGAHVRGCWVLDLVLELD